MICKAAAKVRNSSEVHKSQAMKTFCIGQKDSCKKYYKQYVTNSAQLADTSSRYLCEITAALKSRPMKRLRSMQKRKYGMAPSILGQHKERDDLANKEGAIEYLLGAAVAEGEGEGNGDDGQGEQDEDDQLRIGDFIVLRGMDGLDFNVLKITKEYDPETITARTRIKGDFIIPEVENEHKDHVIFYQDLRRKMGPCFSLMFLRDRDDMIVSVHMETLPRVREMIYKMSKETFEELSDLAREFEASLEHENQVEDIDSNIDTNTDIDREEDSEDNDERPTMVTTR